MYMNLWIFVQRDLRHVSDSFSGKFAVTSAIKMHNKNFHFGSSSGNDNARSKLPIWGGSKAGGDGNERNTVVEGEGRNAVVEGNRRNTNVEGDGRNSGADGEGNTGIAGGGEVVSVFYSFLFICSLY